MLNVDHLYMELSAQFPGEMAALNRMNQLQRRCDPHNQLLSLKETVFTLFPSTKPDASLRIHKQTVDERQQIVVTVNPQYEEQIFQMSPNLREAHNFYQRYNRGDFWAHVVCAANENQRQQQKSLGFAAKDEFKEARNMIRDLHVQIAYRSSVLQARLQECLQLTRQHEDLLLSYQDCSSYKPRGKSRRRASVTSQKSATSPQANIIRSQYLTWPTEFHELTTVLQADGAFPSGYYGPAAAEPDVYISDSAFFLIRQINCFSNQLLQCYRQTNDGLSEPAVPHDAINVDIAYLTRNINSRVAQRHDTAAPANQVAKTATEWPGTQKVFGQSQTRIQNYLFGNQQRIQNNIQGLYNPKSAVQPTACQPQREKLESVQIKIPVTKQIIENERSVYEASREPMDTTQQGSHQSVASMSTIVTCNVNTNKLEQKYQDKFSETLRQEDRSMFKYGIDMKDDTNSQHFALIQQLFEFLVFFSRILYTIYNNQDASQRGQTPTRLGDESSITSFTTLQKQHGEYRSVPVTPFQDKLDKAKMLLDQVYKMIPHGEMFENMSKIMNFKGMMRNCNQLIKQMRGQ